MMGVLQHRQFGAKRTINGMSCQLYHKEALSCRDKTFFFADQTGTLLTQLILTCEGGSKFSV